MSNFKNQYQQKDKPEILLMPDLIINFFGELKMWRQEFVEDFLMIKQFLR